MDRSECPLREKGTCNIDFLFVWNFVRLQETKDAVV